MTQNDCNEYRFNRDGYDAEGYDINGFDKNRDSDTFCVLHVIDTYQSITHCAFLKKNGNEKQFNKIRLILQFINTARNIESYIQGCSYWFSLSDRSVSRKCATEMSRVGCGNEYCGNILVDKIFPNLHVRFNEEQEEEKEDDTDDDDAKDIRYLEQLLLKSTDDIDNLDEYVDELKELIREYLINQIYNFS
jgi:hypothetical protein